LDWHRAAGRLAVGPGSVGKGDDRLQAGRPCRVVVQDYRQVRADGEEFSGHGVFMIDSADGMSSVARLPILWWFFDSYGYPPQPAHGGWQDGELIMQKTTPRGMAEHRFAIADDQLSYRIRLRLDDTTELEDFLSGKYRRISGH
jgi:hypothetical protein